MMVCARELHKRILCREIHKRLLCENIHNCLLCKNTVLYVQRVHLSKLKPHIYNQRVNQSRPHDKICLLNFLFFTTYDSMRHIGQKNTRVACCASAWYIQLCSVSTYAHIEEGISNYVLCLCARQVRYARAVCLRAEPVPRAATGVSPVSSLALVGARQPPIPLVAQDPTLGTPPGLPIAVQQDPKLLSHPSPVS